MADSITAAAAVKLMMRFPFWCELYYSMKVIETPNVPTLATDGKRMWVNPQFWGTLSFDHKVSALAHEAAHKMLHHPTRGRTLDPQWANIAMDIVVNTMLHENGFPIAPSWVQPQKKYSGWTFEAVYHDITKDRKPPPPQGGGTQPKKDEGKQQQPGGKDAGQKVPPPQKGQGKADGKGEGQGAPQDAGAGEGLGSGFCDAPDVPQQYQGAWRDVQQMKGSEEEVAAHEEKVDQLVREAIEAAKAMGTSPKGVEMAVEHTFKVAEESWFDHLHRYFQSLRMSEYDWAKINRRMAVRHRLVAPTQYTPKLGPAVVLIDASGSVFDKAQQLDFTAHVNAILAEAQPSMLYVGYFDTRIHGGFTEIPLGELELTAVPRGGGGTSFVEPLERAEEFVPSVCIVLTDLMGAFPTEPPPFPVVWASIMPGKAPFGETIYIKEKG